MHKENMQGLGRLNTAGAALFNRWKKKKKVCQKKVQRPKCQTKNVPYLRPLKAEDSQKGGTTREK